MPLGTGTFVRRSMPKQSPAWRRLPKARAKARPALPGAAAGAVILTPSERDMDAEGEAMEWMLLPLRRYAEFSGRATRQEYWMFALFCGLLYAAAVIALIVVAGVSA